VDGVGANAIVPTTSTARSHARMARLTQNWLTMASIPSRCCWATP